ncbi:hypothetical protein, partial [Sulfuracidifex metallicus]|uniref:hypothetical protein n=1 Tax=Sulfuracidifex metallicus TaxID=47303 RepID=UPI002276D1BE
MLGLKHLESLDNIFYDLANSSERKAYVGTIDKNNVMLYFYGLMAHLGTQVGDLIDYGSLFLYQDVHGKMMLEVRVYSTHGQLLTTIKIHEEDVDGFLQWLDTIVG